MTSYKVYASRDCRMNNAHLLMPYNRQDCFISPFHLNVMGIDQSLDASLYLSWNIHVSTQLPISDKTKLFSWLLNIGNTCLIKVPHSCEYDDSSGRFSNSIRSIGRKQ